MVSIARTSNSDLVGRIVEEVEKSGPYRKDIGVFTEMLLADLLPRDANAIDPASFASVVASAYDQFSARLPGEHNLKILQADDLGDSGSAFIQIVEDDRPFLVDSVTAELQARDIGVQLVVHPIFSVLRDADGRFDHILRDEESAPDNVIRESVILIQIAALPDEQEYELLAAEISNILDSVETVVADWKMMVAQLDEMVVALSNLPEDSKIENLEESLAFLNWLKGDNFTFLGMRQFRLEGDPSSETADLVPVEGSGLGILRDENVYVLRRGLQQVHMTPEIKKFFFQPSPLIVTKANVVSRVHRRVHMDYVGVKIYDEAGRIIGELRLVGLFTSVAYTHSVLELPLIRQKTEHVLRQSGFRPGGHAAKALINVLETYPRSELFQIDPDVLLEFAVEIKDLNDRPTVRVFPRVDEFDRFVSALVFVPRNKFSTSVRVQIGELLSEAYDGRVSAFYPDFPEGQLVRIHFVIGRYFGETPRPDVQDLEQKVADVARGWEGQLENGLKERFTG